MRVPAVSFDPPVGAPRGVPALAAAVAAGRTAVSPDRRLRPVAPRRPARREPEPEPAAPEDGASPAEPLPAAHPPLAAQRAVLDRRPPVPPPDRRRVPRPTTGSTGPPALEPALRRVIGTA